MMRRFLMTSSLALALAWAAPAAADPIQFDWNGADNTPSGFMIADTFDYLPGNSLLIENATGTAGTILFQANLNSIEGAGGTTFDPQTQCPVGDVCHFQGVAGFGVTITTIPNGAGIIQVFSFDPSNTTNFLNIYASTADVSDLSGNCFVCGTLILEADITATDFASIFTTPNLAARQTLDQFDTDGNPVTNNTDDYAGKQTVVGIGATSLTATVINFDPNYFLNLVKGASLSFINTDQKLPFQETDPSHCFDLDGFGPFLCESGADSVGAVNGLGTRIITQSDANQSFRGVASVVPEPATLSLLGFGLFGAAAIRRRQIKNRKA